MSMSPGRIFSSPRQRTGALIALVVAVHAVLSAGCGGLKGRGPDDDTITLRGTISARGSTPFGDGFLEATDGAVYILQEGPVARELRALDDMDVEVRAILLPQELDDLPVVEVRSYELLPLATGERPIVGFIRANPINDYAYLVDAGGLIYHIQGDFRRTLMDYNGAKVWLVGEVTFSTTRLHERSIDVTTYGIIADRGGLQF